MIALASYPGDPGTRADTDISSKHVDTDTSSVIQLYDVRTGVVMATRTARRTTPITALSFSEKSSNLYSTFEDGRVRVGGANEFFKNDISDRCYVRFAPSVSSKHDDDRRKSVATLPDMSTEGPMRQQYGRNIKAHSLHGRGRDEYKRSYSASEFPKPALPRLSSSKSYKERQVDRGKPEKLPCVLSNSDESSTRPEYNQQKHKQNRTVPTHAWSHSTEEASSGSDVSVIPYDSSTESTDIWSPSSGSADSGSQFWPPADCL